MKFNAFALGSASAIIAAAAMLLLGIFGNFGLYLGAVDMMQQWHMFFSLSIGGIVLGMIEATLFTFIFVYAFAWLYNTITQRISNKA